MSVMRDYAKKDFSVPKREKRPEPLDHKLMRQGATIAGILFAGALLGAILGYGLLYTGV